MFTGIVDAQGIVKKIQKKGQNFRLAIKVPRVYGRLKIGSSVAVDGVCLTVVARHRVGATQWAAPTLSFDVIPETLKRTHFRALSVGDKLNLERPLKWKGRVHGHLVQGHVDGVVKVLKVSCRGTARRAPTKHSFQLSFPKKLRRVLVEKGSVALNGVSLTIGRVARGSFWVHGIPHTLRKTNLKEWKTGTIVNLETDFMLRAG